MERRKKASKEEKGEMGVVEEYLPAMAMLGIQAIYAIVTLISRAALLEGMSPRVFIVYRQAFATLSIAPIAYLSRLDIHSSFSKHYLGSFFFL